MSLAPVRAPVPLHVRILAALVFAVGIAMAAWTLYYMVIWHSPAPYMDQWGVIGQPLRLDTLFNQHNEHRIAVPRLIFFLDDLAGGQQLVNKAVNWLIAGLAAYYAMRVTLFGRPPKALAPILLVFGSLLALAYNGSQYANFDWGFQVQFLGVYALGIYVLFCGLQTLNWPGLSGISLAKAYLAIAAATFTMANGFLCGIALTLFFLVAGGRIRWRLALATFAFTAVLFALYLMGFHFVENHTSLSDALSQPVRLMNYFAGVMGAALDYPWGVALGYAMLAAMLAALVGLWRAGFPPAQTALLAVATFIAMSAGIIALGRSEFPLPSSATSRYDTPSLYALIALAGIAFRSLLDARRRRGAAWLVACGLALVSSLVPLALQSKHQDRFAERWLGRQRAATAMINSVAYQPDTRFVYPDPNAVQRRLPILKSQSLSIFAGDLDEGIGQPLSSFGAETDGVCEGVFDELVPHLDGALTATARGWAVGPGRPKVVYFVSPDNQVRAVGFSGMPRPDVAEAMQRRDALHAGFQATFPQSAAGTDDLTAIADFGDGRLCRLRRSHALSSVAVTRVTNGAVPSGQAIGAMPEIEGGWSLQGGFRTLATPPSGDVWWGSWSGADSNSGTLTWPAVALEHVGAIEFLVAGGPTTSRLSVSFNTPGTGEVIQRISLQGGEEGWVRVTAPVPAGVEVADIQFTDAGIGWGEWMAVADVRLVGVAE